MEDGLLIPARRHVRPDPPHLAPRPGGCQGESTHPVHCAAICVAAVTCTCATAVRGRAASRPRQGERVQRPRRDTAIRACRGERGRRRCIRATPGTRVAVAGIPGARYCDGHRGDVCWTRCLRCGKVPGSHECTMVESSLTVDGRLCEEDAWDTGHHDAYAGGACAPSGG